MGFMTGFIGGFTLTASVLYISAQVHRSIRLAQRDAIREQVEILNDLSSPLGAYYRRFASDDESHGIPIAPQARKPSAEELLKQQWNSEVKALARKTQNLRWQDVTNRVTDIGRMVWDLTKRQ